MMPGVEADPVKTEPTENFRITDAASSSSNGWHNERRLVTALCTLQQMHAKINELRSLVPGRLLGPLRPVITQPPGCDKYQKSPQELCQEITQSARDGLAEIQRFQMAWRSPEMTAILDRVDVMLIERNNEYPRMRNVWDGDYEEALANLDRDSRLEEERWAMQQDLLEKEKLDSTAGAWISIVDTFRARNIPKLDIQTLSADGSECFVVEIQSIHTSFYVQRTRGALDHDADVWNVSLGFQQNPTSLVLGILDCIQSRDRKWDLQYLLEMIASYVNIKSSPCTACSKLIAAGGQLPTVRKPKPALAPNDNAITWDPFHTQCV